MPSLATKTVTSGLTTGLVFEPLPINHLDDLATITFNGVTQKVDWGTNDTVYGTASADVITLYSGNDTAYGYGGNDTFILHGGNDTVDGGEGLDTVDYTSSQYTVIADLQTGFIFADGIDQVTSVERINGSQWNDTMLGSSGADQFYGGAGNDKLVGRGGDDILNGGAGDDKMFGDTEATPDLAYGNDTMYGGAGNDWMTGGQNSDVLYGGTENDTMFGGEGFYSDKLYGEAGNDKLDGGQGDDLLFGGAGFDIMTGGQGADKFVFTSFSEFTGLNPGGAFKYGVDRITDFQHGVDKIDLSAIDANPNLAGDQAFFGDAYTSNSPTVSVNLPNRPGPYVDGDVGHVDIRYSGGNTYVYVENSDGIVGASIELVGHINLTASDFIF